MKDRLEGGTFGVPKANCPNCGHGLEQVTAIGHGQEPKAGDVTVCINCAEILRFNSDRSLDAVDRRKDQMNERTNCI